ncbi:MAG: hypothetical protein O6909_11580 [Alphaproteobacteria bacterium]|nr:hypothetical protein [Alphaproteobacteria bacterium]
MTGRPCSPARRIGIERALLIALGVIALATAARVAGNHAAVLFGSAFVVGLGVAGCQAYIPTIAKRHFGTNVPVDFGGIDRSWAWHSHCQSITWPIPTRSGD